MELICSPSIRPQHSSGSGPTNTKLVAPTSKPGIMQTCIWAEWKSGSECNMRSSWRNSNASMQLTYSARSALCVNTAPLGEEVVPDV